MFGNIFDIHAHYDDPCFAENLSDILLAQRRCGVEAIINCGYHLPSSRASAELAARHNFIYAAVGVFPLEAAHAPSGWLAAIRTLAGQPRVVAIGEVGLDYHIDTHDRAVQIDLFEQQLQLAAELNLPVQVHTRDADKDTLHLLSQHRPRGVIHRFASGFEAGRAYLGLGLALSIGPNITYPSFSHVQDTVRAMPLEKLVLETDAPFLAPFGIEENPVASDVIIHVANVIANIKKDITTQQILNISYQNAKNLFLGCQGG